MTEKRIHSQRKGARAERELAGVLSELLGTECRKGSSPYLPGIIAPDVYGLDGIHIEVKRLERLRLPAAIRQAKEDALPDEVAAVAHRPNRNPWMLTIMLDDLPRLAEAVTRLNARNNTGGQQS